MKSCTPSRLSSLVLAALLLGGCGGPDGPELVRRPAVAPSSLVIRNVDVLDVETGAIERARDVLVQDDRIAAIGLGGTLRPPAGAGVVDGAGATLLPGLVDMHGHIYASSAPTWTGELPTPERNLRSYLYSGVTTVLDPADSSGDGVPRRDEVASGALLGPRIFTAGKPLTALGGHPVALVRLAAPRWIGWFVAPRTSHQVTTPEEARAAVEALAGEGVDFVKIIVDRIPADVPRLSNDEIRAAVDAARAQGLRSIAHIGSLEDALDAGRAGVSLWVHGVYKERIPDAAIAELGGFGIPMVPTTTVFESYALVNDANRAPTQLERETASPDVLAAFNELPDSDRLLDSFRPFLETLRAERRNWRDNVRRLHGAGVVILAGADTQSGVFPGPGLHRELRLLEESGLTPVEVIRAATLHPARYLEQTDDPSFGQVKLGKRADLLLVEGDPTANLAALENIRAVFQGGVQLERTPIGG